MNIYQKKIVKEKEYIFYEDCVKTKSTCPNSKPDFESEIHSSINIRQLYGINPRKINKKNNISNNNRHPRSKSQIINDRRKTNKYTQNGIKTVLIKFNKPIDQNCNEKERNNITNASYDLKYKTYFTEKFYNNNKRDKLEAQQLLINNKENIINVDLSFENFNNKSNVISFYLPFQENKNTRNKSAILQNEYFSNTNNSINSSFNSIYKKSFCIDKHKNYGGNFKNKEKEKSNPKIVANKSFNNIKYNKKVITKNISSPNMQNIINISEINENLNKKENNKLLNHIYKKIFQYNKNNGTKSTSNEIKKINIKYDLQNGGKKINTKNMAKNEEDNNVLNKSNIPEFQDKHKQNKGKRKNIPPLNFKNNIKKNNSNINNYNENIHSKLQNFYNQKYLNNRINTSQFGSIKNKENILTFEESINDAFSMKNNIKNKGNLFNIINISEQVSKRDHLDQIYKNSEIDKVSNYINKKENNKIKLVKRNNNGNNNNNNNNNSNIAQKSNNQKSKIKTKGKIFRTNSAKNIEAKGYQIKSIPLKLGTNKNTKYINLFNNITNNIQNFQNKNSILSNVVFINKKDFSLWNDLTRIYDNNGKFQ